MNQKWRELDSKKLKEALLKLGIDPVSVEEYLDDPNAIPKEIKTSPK